MSPERKLFIVEFGKPDITNSIFAPSPFRSLYVLALSYDEAAAKALVYAEEKISENPSSVIAADGSLRQNIENKEPLSVKGVRLASDEVIW